MGVALWPVAGGPHACGATALLYTDPPDPIHKLTSRRCSTCPRPVLSVYRCPVVRFTPVGGGEGEGNLDGVRVGLGHRFAAAWVRVRA